MICVCCCSQTVLLLLLLLSHNNARDSLLLWRERCALLSCFRIISAPHAYGIHIFFPCSLYASEYGNSPGEASIPLPSGDNRPRHAPQGTEREREGLLPKQVFLSFFPVERAARNPHLHSSGIGLGDFGDSVHRQLLISEEGRETDWPISLPSWRLSSSSS